MLIKGNQKSAMSAVHDPTWEAETEVGSRSTQQDCLKQPTERGKGRREGEKSVRSADWKSYKT